MLHTKTIIQEVCSLNRIKPSIIFWRSVEDKAALDEEVLRCWTTTAMSLLDSPVPTSLTSEKKAIILVVVPSAVVRIFSVLQRPGWPLLPMMKEQRTVKQQWRRCC